MTYTSVTTWQAEQYEVEFRFGVFGSAAEAAAMARCGIRKVFLDGQGMWADLADGTRRPVMRHREGRLPLNEPVEEICNLSLVFKPVPTPVAANYIRLANARAGRDLPAIQMVWPDPEGYFPWEPGFAKRFAPMQLALYHFVH